MEHYYERNIVDIKCEYLTYLTDVLVPLIYEGLQSIYNHALDQHTKFEEYVQTYPNAKNPGIIKIFQACLKDIPSLSAGAIEIEVKRIKEFSRCSEWFDDLVKAVIKSYIVLLTYNSSGKTCKLVNEKFHEKINVSEFIHKCYMECAIVFYNNPELFWNEHPTETSQICKKSAYKYVRQCIIDAIHKMLPIKLILQEYLSNDYIVKSPHTSEHKKSHNTDTEHKSEHPSHMSPVNGFRQISSEENIEHHSNVEHKKLANINSQDVRDNLEQMIDDDKNDNVAQLSDEHQDIIVPNINPNIKQQPEQTKITVEQKQNELIPPIQPSQPSQPSQPNQPSQPSQPVQPIKPINFETQRQDIPINIENVVNADNKVLSERGIDAYFDKYF